MEGLINFTKENTVADKQKTFELFQFIQNNQYQFFSSFELDTDSSCPGCRTYRTHLNKFVPDKQPYRMVSVSSLECMLTTAFCFEGENLTITKHEYTDDYFNIEFTLSVPQNVMFEVEFTN